VSELEPASLVAPVAVFADEAATSFVLAPRLPAVRGFEVPSLLTLGSRLSYPRGSRLGCDAALALVNFGQECVEGAIEK